MWLFPDIYLTDILAPGTNLRLPWRHMMLYTLTWKNFHNWICFLFNLGKNCTGYTTTETVKKSDVISFVVLKYAFTLIFTRSTNSTIAKFIFINWELIVDILHWWEENHHITLNPKMVGCSICCSFKSGLTSFHTIWDDLSILYYFPFLLVMHLFLTHERTNGWVFLRFGCYKLEMNIDGSERNQPF